MSDKKIIAVVGATGAQGGGLVHAIVNDPASGFAVRALTRKVDSEKGKELTKPKWWRLIWMTWTR